MQILDSEKPYKWVEGRHGWFRASPLDIYVGRSLLTYGEYGEMEYQLVEQLLRPGMDAIEVGANIGGHSVPMARKLSLMGRRLLAVEPQPVIFEHLRTNIGRNSLINVTAENLACGDKPGWRSFRTPDYRGEYNFAGIPMLEDGLGDQRVRAQTLDALAPPDFITGFIKIDAEGEERNVLEGASQIIFRHRPILYLDNNRAHRSKALIEWLWAAGYKMCWHIPFFFNPGNFAGKAENIYPNVCLFNLLAVPRDAPMNPNDFVEIVDSDYHPLHPRPA